MVRSADVSATERTPPLLWWIVVFKAIKAASLFALGAFLLSTRHLPADTVLAEVAHTLNVSLSSRLLQRAMAAAVSLTPRRELLLAFAAFAYGALFAVEGIGLSFRAPWARWLTLVATSGLVPVELYEIARRPTLPRILVLLVNVGVVVYLARRKDVFDAGRPDGRAHEPRPAARE
jgi:uncharacterized membrane protein (DUF2068 family)